MKTTTTTTTTPSHDRVLDAVKAMRRLERTVYYQQPATTTVVYCCDSSPTAVTIASRNAMRQWTRDLLNFLNLSSADICPIAANYVDRYLAVHAATVLQDRTVYQRLVMVALYTALKIHGTGALLDPLAVSALSRQAFSVEDIEAQERQLLEALQWRLSPPTAVQFVRQFVQLVEDPERRERIEKVVLEQIEVMEWCSEGIPVSRVAFQAFGMALRCCSVDDAEIKRMEGLVADCINVDSDTNAEISMEEENIAAQSHDTTKQEDTSPRIPPRRSLERRFSPRSVEDASRWGG